MESANELLTILPLIIIGVAGLFVMMLDAFTGSARLAYVSAILFSAAALAVAVSDLFGPMGESFHGLITYGGTAAFGMVLVMMGTLFSVILSRDYLEKTGRHIAEVYSMILFAAFGMLLLVASNNLITLFLGIETMSISLYVLAGLVKNEKKSVEAALKYFLLGAFATGFLLYGIALLYGASGSTFLLDIAATEEKGMIYWAGVGLLLVGFFFKISAVPFHMWTPDVYQGAPTTITAFMATASKSAAFVAFILVLSRALPDARAEWSDVIWLFALLTMVIGNILALVQDNVKRMLAYSSIAHAGYVLVGVVAANSHPSFYMHNDAILFYLVAYTFAVIGAFGVLSYFARRGQEVQTFEDLGGLGLKHPFIGLVMGIFMLSAAGFPPTAGFLGKFYIFRSGVDVYAQTGETALLTLVIVGVLASVVGAFYYLRVLVYMFMKPARREFEPLEHKGTRWALVICAVLTLYIGILPAKTIELSQDAVMDMTGVSEEIEEVIEEARRQLEVLRADDDEILGLDSYME